MKTASNAGAGFIALGLLLTIPWSRAADPFAENVRSTPWLSPQDEQRAFHVPPGFEVQLVVSEPDILKPMNFAFDDQGRIWVTVTREYPYPVLPPEKPGRDGIMIVQDDDNDGRADKVSRFTTGLNIPIGIYPTQDGAVAWSIPYLWKFTDKDGDGQADDRQHLYGPLGFDRDTHGMNSSFQRGFDGWLYVTHGYNNNTTVSGRDGHSISMNSGNTYRVRLDGSRVEQHTFGQVNPFGLCFDPLGNLFSADCHSAPIYQLLRGGYYPSFGKPHDGLGFAPTTITHSHGSTAISGIASYADILFPQEFRGNLFIGNVMTSRVNRDALTEMGSTYVGKEMPDLVTTDDPWFRPVHIQLGPDGALYFADFYNRIIGHYEVPLNHPGRDRTSGRIWRLVYRGPDGKSNARPRRDLTRLDVAGLVQALGDENLTYRLLSMNRLVDHYGPAAAEPVQRALQASAANSYQFAHGLWVLERLHALSGELLAQAARHPDRLVRTHAMRILAERVNWEANESELALAGLKDSDAFVQRCAAEALGLHPALRFLQPLLTLRHQVPAADTHMTYVVRKAIRDELLDPDRFTEAVKTPLASADTEVIADVALAIPTPPAAAFILDYLRTANPSPDRTVDFLRHAARYLPANKLDDLAHFTRQRFANDLDFQTSLFESVQSGLQQRGIDFSPGLKEWGRELAGRLIESTANASLRWTNTPIEGARDQHNPWSVQNRSSADGKANAPFLCSLPGGEQSTGTLRSQTFRIPPQLKFFIAGHDGWPDKPAQKNNALRLRSAASGAVLAETYPPRNDLAQPVTWDLAAWAGQEGYLEITDADTGTAYAWLAVGRFDPPVVRIPNLDPKVVRERQLAGAKLAALFHVEALQEPLAGMLQDDTVESESRAGAGAALLQLDWRAASMIEKILQDGASARVLCERLAQALMAQGQPRSDILLGVLPKASYRLQVSYAESLAGNPQGAETLLAAAEKGTIPARVLLERSVRNKLIAAHPNDAEARVTALTRDLEPLNEKLQKLIDQRRKDFVSQSELATGHQLFTQHCGVCHQIAGQGGLIGPQLDGIGNRGLDRLCEDVLDPNRNVDRAFRSTLLILKDGDVVSGLFRRQEGAQLVLAESTGKEIFVPSANVTERRESDTSLMPDNFSELLSAEQFNQLMSFLLSQRGSSGAQPAATGR